MPAPPPEAAASRWSWRVPEEATLLRADVAIHGALEQGRGEWTGEAVPCSRSQLKRLIDEGRATADGEPVRAGARLAPGALVEVRFPPPKPLGLVPEDRPLEILHEDEHLLVLSKPQGLTVHPSSTQAEGTLVHALLHHVRDLSGIGGVLRPGIVHRLDKDTSGAMVVTKTDEAHRGLVAAFSRHDIERAYWALCYGSPAEASGRIESLIGRNPADRMRMSMAVKEGRKAVSGWRRVEEYALARARPFASFLEVRIETGRTHQVRVHLTGLGHSLLGDPVYGTPSSKQPKWLALPPEARAAVEALPGQALHARVLGFAHPVTGERLRFEAEPPAAFARLLETLRKHG